VAREDGEQTVVEGLGARIVHALVELEEPAMDNNVLGLAPAERLLEVSRCVVLDRLELVVCVLRLGREVVELVGALHGGRIRLVAPVLVKPG